MSRETIAIAIRSRRDPPRVRFERSEAIGAGTIAIVVVDGVVVVRCASTAAVDALAFGGAGEPSALALRDGDIEVTVRSTDADGEPAPRSAAERFVAEVRSPVVAPSAAGLVVREAEWLPEREDAEFARSPLDVSGDAPTRMQLLSEVLPGPLPAPPPAAAGAAPVDARRKLLRRVALVSMLLCAFALAMRAARVKAARARAVAHAAAPAPGEEGSDARAATARSSAGGAASSDPPDVVTLRRATAPLAASELAPAPALRREAGSTKARRAADALANGAYADALVLYEELAAEHPGNAAYDATARILRSRLDRPTVTSR